MTEAHARMSDPSTSHEAAERIAATKMEEAVYSALLAHGTWMSVIEISDAMGIDKWSVSPRMLPLFNKGRVDRDKAPRLNSNGRIVSLQIWKARKP